MNEPTYLGDGVYAKYDGYHIRLDAVHIDTSDYASSDTIFLDQTVWQALVDYGDRVFERTAEDEIGTWDDAEIEDFVYVYSDEDDDAA